MTHRSVQYFVSYFSPFIICCFIPPFFLLRDFTFVTNCIALVEAKIWNEQAEQFFYYHILLLYFVLLNESFLDNSSRTSNIEWTN